MMLRSLGLAAAFALFATTAFAQTLYRDVLLNTCRDVANGRTQQERDRMTPDQRHNRSWCIGYLKGVIESQMVASTLTEQGPWFCPPSGQTTEDFAIAVTGYLETHTFDQKWAMTMIAWKALIDLYPCPKP